MLFCTPSLEVAAFCEVSVHLVTAESEAYMPLYPLTHDGIGDAACRTKDHFVTLKALVSQCSRQAPGEIVLIDCLLYCRSFKIARVWMPVNLIFVGMIWTSFFALKNLGVPMATVLKNVTNLFTIVGDYLLYGKVCHRLQYLHSASSVRACP